MATLARACRHLTSVSSSSATRVLLLFSGPSDGPDGLRPFLRQRGVEVDMVDFDADAGGVEQHHTLDDAFLISLFQLVTSGAYRAILAAPPCRTYSVARFFPNGAPVVRDRANVKGKKDCPAAHARELRRAKEVTVTRLFYFAQLTELEQTS